MQPRKRFFSLDNLSQSEKKRIVFSEKERPVLIERKVDTTSGEAQALGRKAACLHRAGSRWGLGKSWKFSWQGL